MKRPSRLAALSICKTVTIACGAMGVALLAVPSGGATTLTKSQSPPIASESPEALPAAPATAAQTVRVLRTGGVRADIAALLLSGQEGGTPTFAAHAWPGAASGRERAVALALEIDGQALLAGAGDLLRLDVAAYAIDAKGALSATLAETIEVDLASDAARVALDRAGLRYEGTLRLPAGDYGLRLLVRPHHTLQAAARTVRLVVPEAGAADWLPPRFPASAAWLLAARAGDPAAPTGAARPVLVLEQEATFELTTGHSVDAAIDLRVELVAAGGDPTDVMATWPAALLPGGPAAGSESSQRARVTPSGVAPGEYRLRVRGAGVDQTGSPSAAAVASPSIECVVVPAETRVAVWTELVPRAAAPRPPPVASAPRRAPPSRLSRSRAAAIEASYKAALAALARGEETRARTEVESIERQTLEGAQAVSPDELADVEVRVLQAAAAAAPRAWLPVLGLYGSIYSDAIAARRYLHSTHARQMAFTLVEALVKREASAGPLAGRFLAVFAARMLRAHGAGNLSRRALDRALELDPQNATARLCLALQLSQRGEARAALSALEPLVERGEREARLRRAVDLLRVGSGREKEVALGELRELTRAERDGRDWIVALAHQEISRHALAAGRLGEAEQEARRGLESFPDDQKLLLLLAFVEERRRQPARARQEADRVGIHAAGASPRRRYAELPDAAIARDAAEFERAAREAWPLLAAGLARTKQR